MKLLFENWRKYLTEATAQEMIDALKKEFEEMKKEAEEEGDLEMVAMYDKLMKDQIQKVISKSKSARPQQKQARQVQQQQQKQEKPSMAAARQAPTRDNPCPPGVKFDTYTGKPCPGNEPKPKKPEQKKLRPGECGTGVAFDTYTGEKCSGNEPEPKKLRPGECGTGVAFDTYTGEKCP